MLPMKCLFMESNLSLKKKVRSGAFPAFFMPFVFFISTLSVFAQNSSDFVKVLRQETGTLCYLTPVEMKGKDIKLEMDFTLFYHPDSLNNTFVKFTTLSKEPLKELDSLFFLVGNKRQIATVNDIYYLEKKRSKWKSRFEAEMSYNDFTELLKNYTELTKIAVVRNEPSYRRVITKKQLKKLKKSMEIALPILSVELDFEG